MMTRNQLLAVIAVADAILEAVKSAGDQGVPSGHLYANLMGQISLNTYDGIINILTKSGKISQDNHLLRATR